MEEKISAKEAYLLTHQYYQNDDDKLEDWIPPLVFEEIRKAASEGKLEVIFSYTFPNMMELCNALRLLGYTVTFTARYVEDEPVRMVHKECLKISWG